MGESRAGLYCMSGTLRVHDVCGPAMTNVGPPGYTTTTTFGTFENVNFNGMRSSDGYFANPRVLCNKIPRVLDWLIGGVRDL